jgi:hypothetical protein
VFVSLIMARSFLVLLMTTGFNVSVVIRRYSYSCRYLVVDGVISCLVTLLSSYPVQHAIAIKKKRIERGEMKL